MVVGAYYWAVLEEELKIAFRNKKRNTEKWNYFAS
jgi:hypothetical protein